MTITQKVYRLGEYRLIQTNYGDTKHNDFYVHNEDGSSTILPTNGSEFNHFLLELVNYKNGFPSGIVEVPLSY